MNWFDAHFLALHSVTPRHGKKFFGRCGIPLCQSFKDGAEEDEEEENNIILVLVALSYFLVLAQATRNINLAIIFIILKKIKQ